MSPTVRLHVLCALSGAVAGLGVLTINGGPLLPGIHGDSVEYLAAAESFRHDGDFVVPLAHWSSADSVAALSHFPPGFPVLISLALGGDAPPPAAALAVMAVSAALAVTLLTLLVGEPFGPLAALLSAALLLTAPVWVRLHLAVWSEPSFMAITSALLYALVRWRRAAWAHGLLAAAGVMIRYVGIAGTLASAVWAWRGSDSLKTRLSRVAAATLPSALFLLWWQHGASAGGEVVRRSGMYGDLAPNVRQATAMLTEWAVPGGREGAGPFAAVLLALMAFVAVAAWRKGAWKEGPRRLLLAACLLFAACHTGVVVAARILADPRILFDARMLMPALVPLTLILVASAVELSKAWGGIGRAALLMAAGTWCLAAVREDRAMVSAVSQRGMYYTFLPWAIDPSIRWIGDSAGAFDRIYSNEPALVHFQTGRYARHLPVAGEDLAAFERTFRAAPGPVAVFYPLQPGHLSPELLVAPLALRLIVQGRMGVVYGPMGS